MAAVQPESQPFTRHLFRSACDCPTKLFYKAQPGTYPKKKEQLPFLAHIRYNKRQLRRLLQLCYPKGVNIKERNYQKGALETADLLHKEYAVIFNASFLYANLFARVPVLEKDGNRVRVFYLKTKAFNLKRHSLTDHNQNIHPKWRDYIRDFAYLLYIIAQGHPEWKLEPYLVLPDKTATTEIDCLDQKLSNGGKVDPKKASKLLAFVDVYDQTNRFLSGNEPIVEEDWGDYDLSQLEFGDAIKQFAVWYFNKKKVDVGVGKKCAGCEFRVQPDNIKAEEKSGFGECWQKMPGYEEQGAHIFDLIGAGNGQLLNDQVFIQQNVDLDSAVSIEQIAGPGGRISDQHRRILQVAKAKGARLPREIIKPQLFTELQKWKYPLHFLDFEAGSFAVPVRSCRNPYDMVVFQFSCHSLYADGSLEHHQWLHRGDVSYPNFELVKELKKVPNLSRGTIVHYSGFERSALKRLRSEIKDNPKDLANAGELVQWLDGIIESPKVKSGPSPKMADLSRLVKFHYYNREMADSLSIKDVVESIMKISPELKQQYSKPYNSSNFSNFIWWQQKNGQLISPYQLLQEHPEGSIREGAEAMVAYAQLRSGNLNPNEAEVLRQSLLRYCELDTLAMMMIYRHWKSVMMEQLQDK